MGTRLNGRISLVTGASKGIGKAVSELFASEGATVVLVSRDSGKLSSVVKGITDVGGDAIAIPGDIADDLFVEGLFAKIKEGYGRLDILVNNAGMVDGGGDITNVSPAKLREVLNLNVVAAFHCMQQAIRIMRENGDVGKIINIGSVRSHWTEQGEAGGYNASKYAIRGLSETVARLLMGMKSNIAIGLVCPGITDTPIHDKWSKEGDSMRKDWLKPETVAEAVLHSVLAPANINIFDTILFPTAQIPF